MKAYSHPESIQSCISFEMAALDAAGRLKPELRERAQIARNLLAENPELPTVGDPIIIHLVEKGIEIDAARKIAFGLARLERADPYSARVYFFNECAEMFNELKQLKKEENTNDGFY